MMTEQEHAIVERELKEAERKGYQKALLDLQRCLNEQTDSAEHRFAGLRKQFIWGVIEGLSIAREWAYNKTDI